MRLVETTQTKKAYHRKGNNSTKIIITEKVKKTLIEFTFAKIKGEFFASSKEVSKIFYI